MSVSMSKEKAKVGSSLRPKDIIITAVIVLICVVSILPLYILIVNSTRAGQDITSNGVSLIPGLNLFKNISQLFVFHILRTICLVLYPTFLLSFYFLTNMQIFFLRVVI